MRKTREPKVVKIRCPFKVKSLEDALSGRGMQIPVYETRTGTFFNLTKNEVDTPVFSKPTGYLKTLSETLGSIVSYMAEDGSNYTQVLREWCIAFMRGLLEYRKDDLRLEFPPPDLYEKIFARYEQVFRKVFVAEDVSDENYEDLEFAGDAAYKSSLTFQLILVHGVKNKAVSTALRHHFEKTKAMANLAAIFHMEPIIRTNGSKRAEALSEDVCEAVMGAMEIVERALLQDPTTPEFALLAAKNGFAERMTRLVFDCTTYNMDVELPGKTFVVGFSHLFSVGGEKISVVDNAADYKIVLVTPPSVVTLIAKTFAVDVAELGRVLNASFTMSDRSGNTKFFSSKVFDDIADRLAELGITQQAVQMHKNMRIIPALYHDRMNIIGQIVQNKGYWLGINLPKNIKSHAEAVIQGVFYHNVRHRPTPKIEVPCRFIGDTSASYATLFEKLEAMAKRLTSIVSEQKPKVHDNIISVRIREKERIVNRATGPIAKSGAEADADPRRRVRQRTVWADAAAKSMMRIGDQKKVPTAGKTVPVEKTMSSINGTNGASRGPITFGPEELFTAYQYNRAAQGDNAVFPIALLTPDAKGEEWFYNVQNRYGTFKILAPGLAGHDTVSIMTFDQATYPGNRQCTIHGGGCPQGLLDFLRKYGWNVDNSAAPISVTLFLKTVHKQASEYPHLAGMVEAIATFLSSRQN